MTFKETVLNDLLPRILVMIEKEEKHIQFLIEKKSDEVLIETSQSILGYYKLRYKEYKDYIEKF